MVKTLSVIICTMNSEKFLADVLESVKVINPLEILIIDGNSKDKTLKIAEKYNCRIFNDEAKGLGNARNIGLIQSIGDYVLFVGADNILKYDKDIFNNILKEMKKNKYFGIGLRSELLGKGKSEGLSNRWNNKIKPGLCNVIGTPFMFNRKKLLKYKFDITKKYSDDTDLCDRVFKKECGLFGYSESVLCSDIWMGWKRSVVDRFIMYGRSDREYFKQHYKSWNILRVMKSILHPFQEFESIKKLSDIKYVPFVLFTILLRYIGYAGL